MEEPRTLAEFFVPGVPAPGGSKTGFRHPSTGRVIVKEDCKRTPGWRACVALAARDAYRGEPSTRPIQFAVTFLLPRPKGHYGSGKNAAKLKPSAPRRHTVKPDALKLTRSTEDALTGILWRDDAQIVYEVIGKEWTTGQAGAHILVVELHP